MKKIPTIFERDWEGDRSRVINVPNQEAEWVHAGEGWATRKMDGTCCLVQGGRLFKRRELRPKDTTPPEFVEADFDATTGKRIGWMPIGDGPEDRWHREAFDNLGNAAVDGETYELVGPKIQGNPEKFNEHVLLLHAACERLDEIRTFGGLREWLATQDIEGIVWHHPDGRMAKIKLRDFGLRRENAHYAHPEGTSVEPHGADGAKDPANGA